MQNQSTNEKSLLKHLSKIGRVIRQRQPQRVVLQIGKTRLNQSFALTQALKKQFPQILFFTLYDSMKNPCCVDIIGARHVDYDLLFHFGQACFSEKYDPRHYYIFQSSQTQKIEKICFNLINSSQKIIENGIQAIFVQQSLYQGILTKKMQSKQDVWGIIRRKICRFIFDCNDQQKYIYSAFGYYTHLKKDRQFLSMNALVVCQNEESKLLSKLTLSKSTVGIENIFVLTPQKQFSAINLNITKQLMQRLSLASQLQKYERFGILVSNPSTQFCQITVAYCKQILARNSKKMFTFMMNNLNEIKLGNFPEIQVYIIISCYNHSLYTIKDFFRVVATPFDLQLAFEDKTISQYCVDLRNWKHNSFAIQKQQQKTIINSDCYLNQNMSKNQLQQSGKLNCQDSCACQINSVKIEKNQVAKIHNQVLLANSIQSLDFYRNRQYRGLDFKEKKEIKKMSKGKIGLAEHYQPLKQEQ